MSKLHQSSDLQVLLLLAPIMQEEEQGWKYCTDARLGGCKFQRFDMMLTFFYQPITLLRFLRFRNCSNTQVISMIHTFPKFILFLSLYLQRQRYFFLLFHLLNVHQNRETHGNYCNLKCLQSTRLNVNHQYLKKDAFIQMLHVFQILRRLSDFEP